jgi:dTDP-4-dehydrorhamnose reductase
MAMLVTGASGRLGRYVLREARRRELSLTAWSGHQIGEIFGYPLTPVPLQDRDELQSRFEDLAPSAVLHIAALANVNECYHQPELAEQVNHNATALLAQLASRANARFIQVSTDMVFGGDKAPYRETDPAAPLSVYGQTKARAEESVLNCPSACIARVSLLFGPALGDPPMFFDQLLGTLRNGQPFKLFTDEYRTPLSLAEAARGLCDLLESDCAGIWHLGGAERVSRYEFGRRLAAFLGLPATLLEPASRLDNIAAEPRPADLSLDSSRFVKEFPKFRSQTLEQAFRELRIIDNS